MLVISTQSPAPRRVGGGLDNPEPTGRPRPRRRPTKTRPTPHHIASTSADTAVELPLDQRGAAEAATSEAEALAILAPLVPSGSDLPLPQLAQLVAAKLDGHGAHCATALNPPRAALTIDEVRTRCRALLDALAPVERHAVLALVTFDVRQATR